MPDGAVEFRILGPVGVWVRGRRVGPSARKPRALLAALVLEPNRLIPADHLINVLWGTEAPRTAANTLQVYVSKLRAVLGPAHDLAEDVNLEARHPGYLLRVDPERVDICRFRCLVGVARAEATDMDRACRFYREALDLWRGPALADVGSDRLRHGSAAGLEEEQLTATEEWLALEVAAGRHGEAASTLRSLVASHPYRERLWELLMRALEGAGRRADALAAFRQAQEKFRAELGLEPGPRLEALHRQILAGRDRPAGPGARSPTDPTRDRPDPSARDRPDPSARDRPDPSARDRPDPSARDRPDPSAQERRGPGDPMVVDQLPCDTPHLTGRDRERDHLLGRVRTAAGATAGTVAIDGMAGVGKTALAVHLAHRVATHFPVRLFVDLRGHTAGAEPTPPRVALGMLLRALGVPEARQPRHLDALAALWRSKLAGRRALVVLDNAASTAQVTPLLPGSGDCLTLVTSRRRLVGLDSTVSLSLEVPPAGDAIALLRAVVDDERAAAGTAMTEIAELCGRLPLALRIAGARLRHRSNWSPAYLAGRLRERQRLLPELAAEDRSVAAAFAVSYDHLGAAQRRLFRLLGLVPGADLDRYQAAALTGTDHWSAETVLQALVDANLVLEPAPGRYALHDLLREYARSRADAEEPQASGCLARLLRALVHTATGAAHLLEPLEHDRQPAAGGAAPAGPTLTSRADAMAWLATQRRNLVAAVRYAADAGLVAEAWQLAEALWYFCYLRGYTDDWIRTHRVALAAARAVGDRVGESSIAPSLGYAYRRRGWLRDALTELHAAMAVHREMGDRRRAAATLGKIGIVYDDLGLPRAATDYHRRALSIRREIGDRRGEGNTLNNLAAVLINQHRHDEAIVHLREAIRAFQEVGDRTGEGRALSNLGEAYTMAGRREEAQRCLEAALVLRRERGDRRGEAYTLGHLGNLHGRSSRPGDALRLLARALSIMRDIGDANAECQLLNDIGAVLMDTGRHDEASASFQRALSIAITSDMRYERRRAEEGLDRVSRRR